MKFNRNIASNAFVFILMFMISCTGKHTFYVDHINGNDVNNGKSQSSAWATISKVNESSFRAGDKIMFCGGQTFTGTIHLKNQEGTNYRKITISSYGTDRATILGGNAEALIADSCSFLKIKNIDFVGTGRKNGNTTSGVVIINGNNIVIDSVNVSGFQKAGIKITDSENVRITHVQTSDNGFTGILTGEVYYEPFKLLSKNIYIGYCTVENNPGDPTILDNHSGSGILISGTDGAIVEYCLAKNNGWDQPWEGNGPIGIWAFHSNNVVIQNCIAHSNKTNAKGWDGGGFDFDGGVTNSVMQYNLSYNNMGPGYGLYQYSGAAKWENNVVRYNISYNDGIEIDSSGLQLWNGQKKAGPEMKNALIYNNVFYNDFGHSVKYKWGDVPGLYFANNVFISKLNPVTGEHTKSVFENNLYFQIDNAEFVFTEDSMGIFADPKLILPDSIEFLTEDPSKLKDLEFFKLFTESPCISKGKLIPENGGIDFWGNKLPKNSKRLNIGVWQGEKR
jgi:hypothetical protein